MKTEGMIKERIKKLDKIRMKEKRGSDLCISLTEKIDELKWVLNCPGYDKGIGIIDLE